MRRLGTRVEREDILLVKVSITNVGIAGDDGPEDAVGISLPKDFEGGSAIEGGVAHRKQKSQQGQVRVEIFPHFLDSLANLHNTVQFKVSW